MKLLGQFAVGLGLVAAGLYILPFDLFLTIFVVMQVFSFFFLGYWYPPLNLRCILAGFVAASIILPVVTEAGLLLNGWVWNPNELFILAAGGLNAVGYLLGSVLAKRKRR